MKQKTFLVMMTSDVKICNSVKENLEFLNYHVVIIVNDDFKYKSIQDKLVNFYRKVFKKDKSYKRQLIRSYEENKNLFLLEQQKIKFDFTLVIRPDKFSLKVLEAAKIKSKKMVAYQWDGMSRFPEVTETIDFFDKFYVFDENDIENSSKKLSYTTNFYFDCYLSLFQKKPIYDVYFIGTYDSRINDLISICNKLSGLGLKLNILLATSPKKDLKKYKFIKYIKKPITYYENLELLSQSKMIIDLAHKNLHTGLSFRTFEAIGYQKKLITSNPIVEKYDFYSPQNIFIVNPNFEGLEKFINEEFTPINEEIRNKYSFSNWINFITNQEPFQEINIFK